MTTTVLGANGRLGGMLARYASRSGLGWRVQQRQAPADLVWSGRFDDPAADDICREGSTIINMIGDTGTDADRLHAVNVTFVETLLQRAADRGVAHVILASSAAVYGTGTGAPFRETDPLAPITPYGASKAAMEDTAHAAPRGPKITLLRIGNVAGADALLHAAREMTARGEAMQLHRFENGQAARRSYIGPLDLAQAIATLTDAQIENADVSTLNVAYPAPVSLDDLLARYRTHLLPDLHWVDVPAPPAVPALVVLDVAALQRLHPFAPTTDPADRAARQAAEDIAP